MLSAQHNGPEVHVFMEQGSLGLEAGGPVRAPERSRDRAGELWGDNQGFPDPAQRGHSEECGLEAAVGPKQGCAGAAGGPVGPFSPFREFRFHPNGGGKHRSLQSWEQRDQILYVLF